ncbi:DNA adenine methylase [Roseibium sediminicola]|uniref:site-specific DNA-methyltransferase (adenine-specific) n=1 Tax=Roseibium sediminicola TaxID=2933272 RepID=A0ABT0H261_9HYPH|nr:DNA adenine methylase [Roseibium sp. CAU 1639]MCK7615163.1 DNA adenine methylase [Roseibium sp. CAU 1639]
MESNLFGEREGAGVNPVAPWIGGKRALAKRLVRIIASVEHDTYAEPFVGMGGVFLRRPVAPKSEVINDYSGEVVNLFRILQRHYPQFLDCLKFQITSRREFERLQKVDPSTLTDLERAARFLYLQRTAFGGKVTGQNFGVSKERDGRFNLTTLAPLLEDVHERLAGVTIENLSFEEFIARYDRPEVLFYCDPPYFGCENDYGKGMFDRADFAALADKLRAIEGKAIVSINDTPEIREVFAGLTIKPVKVSYTIAQADPKEFGELIIANFEHPLLKQEAAL